MEPYRVKVVEPIPTLRRPEREKALTRAGHNLFRLNADAVTIDLLTDSGTGAMSPAQWAAMMEGDESYAGATASRRFHTVVRELTGFEHVLPVHQGRAAERMVFSTLLRPGDVVVSNGLFDTTRSHIHRHGGTGIDLPCTEAFTVDSDDPFKGNIDTTALEHHLASPDGVRVRCVVMTVTNNAGGGQPVSMTNLRAVRALCDRHDIPLLLDASRFAENAWLISQREPEQLFREIREVAHATFSLADITWASLKKDGLGNIGAFLACRDPELARTFGTELILAEGYLSYGGLAGRDLAALAQGLLEVTDPAYLTDRADTATWLADSLHKAGVPVLRPAGLHAVYVDAGAALPHIPTAEFPGQAWACELYREGGVRAVELGTLLLGQDGGRAQHELVRLALPRRVYTRSHLQHVIDTAETITAHAADLTGYRILGDQPPLRHFTAVLEPIER